MGSYETMPTIEMTCAELVALEDRSAGIGRDRPVDHQFRCDFDYLLPGAPRWVVGTFYEDSETKDACRKLDEFFGGTPRLQLDPNHWMRVRFQRVVLIDGLAPNPDLAAQLDRALRVRKGMHDDG